MPLAEEHNPGARLWLSKKHFGQPLTHVRYNSCWQTGSSSIRAKNHYPIRMPAVRAGDGPADGVQYISAQEVLDEGLANHLATDAYALGYDARIP